MLFCVFSSFLDEVGANFTSSVRIVSIFLFVSGFVASIFFFPLPQIFLGVSFVQSSVTLLIIFLSFYKPLNNFFLENWLLDDFLNDLRLFFDIHYLFYGFLDDDGDFDLFDSFDKNWDLILVKPAFNVLDSLKD